MSLVSWNDATIEWSNFDVVWEAAEILVQHGGRSGASRQKALDKYLDKDKKKKLIKLIAIIKGEKFEETIEVEELTINIKDVEFVIEEVLSKIKNIIVEKKDV